MRRHGWVVKRGTGGKVEQAAEGGICLGVVDGNELNLTACYKLVDRAVLGRE